MTIRDYTKLVVAVLIVIAVAILGYHGKIESEAVVALLGALAGYVFGNAHHLIERK